MATTNLNSKSLGDILLESGNGSPDHTSPSGSLYSDKDTGKVYRNIDGLTNWNVMSTVAYGEAYYQDAVTATTISTINTWTAVGNNFNEGVLIGFSGNTDTLVLKNGYDGLYEVRGDVTIDYNAGGANYEVGLSLNSLVPQGGDYNGAYIDAVYTREHIGFQTIKNLSGGTTLQFGVRNLDGTANVEIRHAQLFARKID